MIIKESIKEKLPLNNLDDIYVIADFDKTITDSDSYTSWSIMGTSKLVPKEYIIERTKLHEYYRPIEVNESLDLDFRLKSIKDWYKKHVELFIKYKITEDTFKNIIDNINIMKFRKGAKEFLSFLNNNNIPLIIVSAGIGNFIEAFLNKNNCYYDNTYVSSNKIIFKNRIVNGLDKHIIHSLNKNESSTPESIKEKIKNKNTVILLGDLISDINMVNKKPNKDIISVGFFSSKSGSSLDEFKKAFDIVCTDNDDYNKLSNILF